MTDPYEASELLLYFLRNLTSSIINYEYLTSKSGISYLLSSIGVQTQIVALDLLQNMTPKYISSHQSIF